MMEKGRSGKGLLSPFLLFIAACLCVILVSICLVVLFFAVCNYLHDIDSYCDKRCVSCRHILVPAEKAYSLRQPFYFRAYACALSRVYARKNKNGVVVILSLTAVHACTVLLCVCHDMNLCRADNVTLLLYRSVYRKGF